MTKPKPLSRKLLAQGLASALVWIASYVVTRQGWDLDAATAAQVSALASLVGGFAAGWLAREAPELVADDSADPEDPPPGGAV